MPSRVTRSSMASPSGSWPRPRKPCSETRNSSCSISEVRCPKTQRGDRDCQTTLSLFRWRVRESRIASMEQATQLPFAWCKRCAFFSSQTSPLLTYGAGAIYALASFFAFAAPNARFLLFFVVPMPAWACIGAIACFDVYNAFTRRVRAEIPPTPSRALSLRLLSCTVLHFGLGRTRWWTNGWRPLLDNANKI